MIKERASTVNTDDLISQAEAAEVRGVTRSAIHRLIKRGKLASVEIGGHVLVSRAEVKAYRPASAGRPSKAKAIAATKKGGKK